MSPTSATAPLAATLAAQAAALAQAAKSAEAGAVVAKENDAAPLDAFTAHGTPGGVQRIRRTGTLWRPDAAAALKGDPAKIKSVEALYTTDELRKSRFEAPQEAFAVTPDEEWLGVIRAVRASRRIADADDYLLFTSQIEVYALPLAPEALLELLLEVLAAPPAEGAPQEAVRSHAGLARSLIGLLEPERVFAGAAASSEIGQFFIQLSDSVERLAAACRSSKDAATAEYLLEAAGRLWGALPPALLNPVVARFIANRPPATDVRISGIYNAHLNRWLERADPKALVAELLATGNERDFLQATRILEYVLAESGKLSEDFLLVTAQALTGHLAHDDPRVRARYRELIRVFFDRLSPEKRYVVGVAVLKAAPDMPEKCRGDNLSFVCDLNRALPEDLRLHALIAFTGETGAAADPEHAAFYQTCVNELLKTVPDRSAALEGLIDTLDPAKIPLSIAIVKLLITHGEAGMNESGEALFKAVSRKLGLTHFVADAALADRFQYILTELSVRQAQGILESEGFLDPEKTFAERQAAFETCWEKLHKLLDGMLRTETRAFLRWYLKQRLTQDRETDLSDRAVLYFVLNGPKGDHRLLDEVLFCHDPLNVLATLETGVELPALNEEAWKWKKLGYATTPPQPAVVETAATAKSAATRQLTLLQQTLLSLLNATKEELTAFIKQSTHTSYPDTWYALNVKLLGHKDVGMRVNERDALCTIDSKEGGLDYQTARKRYEELVAEACEVLKDWRAENPAPSNLLSRTVVFWKGQRSLAVRLIESNGYANLQLEYQIKEW